MDDESPAQQWITTWVTYASDILPVVLLAAVVLVGIVMIIGMITVKSKLLKIIGFCLGAAVVFLILSNLEAVAAFIGSELSIMIEGGTRVDG